MARRRPANWSLLLQLIASIWFAGAGLLSAHQFPVDGTVLELDDSNFDSAISAFDYILVDFYAPWCGHCKRLAPELDAAAPVLAGLDHPIVIAKINADKYTKLASKYEIDGYPSLKVFMHGIPTDYSGPRKADLLVRYLRKFVAPDVAILESDSAIHNFVESAGTHFPIFIGFGLDESVISEFAKKYKKKAWFCVAKDFSEDVMVRYDFDKVPALVSIHPKYNQQSVFYGPYEGDFLDDFIKQNNLPLAVPITYETLKQMGDDKRKIVVTIMEDEVDSLKLVKILKSAASANRDLVFAYVGVKQWQEFTETFGVDKKTKLPKMLIWDGNEEYYLAEDIESLNDEQDLGSQISRFLEAYRAGRTVQKKLSGPSFIGFINSLIGIRTVYLIVFVVAVIMLIQYVTSQDEEVPHRRHTADSSSPSEDVKKEEYQSGDKED
ncbi:hypothetical protein Taro_027294 [Colocasia esculenta]|uniref:Thioredoxin domain-containing protein n=1 Tax=Colocasia esculenta TaxID=4460 RepID=A0A843VE49_COLES|nr:hypothetical protein [Colocasia esculenta]